MEFGGGRGSSWTSHLTTFDFQLGPSFVLFQTNKSLWHGSRAAWSNCLIRPSVAHLQEVRLDVAESHADLLPWYTAAIAHWPGLKADEDSIQRLSRATSFYHLPCPALILWSEPRGDKAIEHCGLDDFLKSKFAQHWCLGSVTSVCFLNCFIILAGYLSGVARHKTWQIDFSLPYWAVVDHL